MLQSIALQRVGFDLVTEQQSEQCSEDPGDVIACRVRSVMCTVYRGLEQSLRVGNEAIEEAGQHIGLHTVRTSCFFP